MTSRNPRERDRALSRVTKMTVAGGAGAVLATGVLTAWLSAPANAHPGSAVTSSTSPSTSSSSSSSSTEQDDGLSSPTEAPSSAPTDTGSQQPSVTSGGS